MKGKLIVLDGTDGTGKQTQTNKLIERLEKEKYEALMLDFPRYDQPSSLAVRLYLSGEFGNVNEVPSKITSLFYAYDRFSAKQEILDQLNTGKILISNRYTSANLGHQGCKIKDPKERKKFYKWLLKMEYEQLGIPKPDLNLILYCPTEITKRLREKRGRTEDIHEKNQEHQKQAALAFKEAAEILPDFQIIECARNNEMKSIEEIHEIIWKEVQKILPSSSKRNSKRPPSL